MSLDGGVSQRHTGRSQHNLHPTAHISGQPRPLSVQPSSHTTPASPAWASTVPRGDIRAVISLRGCRANFSSTYQRHTFAALEPIWTAALASRFLHALDRQLWSRRAEIAPPGWTFLAVPWSFLFDPNIPAAVRPSQIFAALDRLWRQLSWRTERHFTVMVQSHLEQARAAMQRRHFEPMDFSQVVVFDSRLTALGSSAPRSERAGSARARIPVPLLHGAPLPGLRPAAARAAPEKRGGVLFWAGGCHARVRCGLRAAVEASGAPAAAVRRCGARVSAEELLRQLHNATWALAPRGTYNANYMWGEAVAAGALPIFLWGREAKCTGTTACGCPASGAPHPSALPERSLGTASRVAAQPARPPLAAYLPYSDLVDWDMIGLSLYSDQVVPQLGAAVRAVNPQELRDRQARLAQVRPLFSTHGLLAYVRWRLCAFANDDRAAAPSRATHGTRLTQHGKRRAPQ